MYIVFPCLAWDGIDHSRRGRVKMSSKGHAIYMVFSTVLRPVVTASLNPLEENLLGRHSCFF